MRTFHYGVAQGDQQSFQEAGQEGKDEFRNINLPEELQRVIRLLRVGI
jgi:DNA-directed RNA polymerase subunit beta'